MRSPSFVPKLQLVKRSRRCSTRRSFPSHSERPATHAGSASPRSTSAKKLGNGYDGLHHLVVQDSATKIMPLSSNSPAQLPLQPVMQNHQWCH